MSFYQIPDDILREIAKYNMCADNLRLGLTDSYNYNIFRSKIAPWDVDKLLHYKSCWKLNCTETEFATSYGMKRRNTMNRKLIIEIMRCFFWLCFISKINIILLLGMMVANKTNFKTSTLFTFVVLVDIMYLLLLFEINISSSIVSFMTLGYIQYLHYIHRVPFLDLISCEFLYCDYSNRRQIYFFRTI